MTEITIGRWLAFNPIFEFQYLRDCESAADEFGNHPIKYDVILPVRIVVGRILDI